MANQPDPAPDTAEVPVAKIEHQNTQVEEFVERHRLSLLLGLVAILVIIVGYFGFRFMQKSSYAEAAGAFTGAESIEELQEVISNHPNAVAAGSAELLIAGKLQEEGKEDESYAMLKTFVETRKDHPLYYKGVSDLGLKEHLKGNLDAAVQLLREAASAGVAPGYIEQPALLRLGDALTAQGLEAMANNDEEAANNFFSEAQVAFEDLESRAGQDTSLGRTAKERRERLPHLSNPPLTPEEAAAKAETEPTEPATEDPALPPAELPLNEETSPSPDESTAPEESSPSPDESTPPEETSPSPDESTPPEGTSVSLEELSPAEEASLPPEDESRP